MLIEHLVSYLVPKVTQYLISNLGEWAVPAAQGIGCKVIDFSGEAYAKNREDVERWIRNLVPGERFDDMAVKAVHHIIIFAMQEIAEFIQCEIKLHGLTTSDALKRTEEASQIPAVFERISSKVETDTKLVITNF